IQRRLRLSAWLRESPGGHDEAAAQSRRSAGGTAKGCVREERLITRECDRTGIRIDTRRRHRETREGTVAHWIPQGIGEQIRRLAECGAEVEDVRRSRDVQGCAGLRDNVSGHL